MRYYANPSTKAAREAMSAGLIGAILTPAQGNLLPAGADWCADNGCFGSGYPGDRAWLTWLHRMRRRSESCAFATAPDVVADAGATLKRSRPLLPAIRDLGYPAAFVAQDGLVDPPWDEFDVLFIGGSTGWKLGPAAAGLAEQAHRHGKPVHVGRVNSAKRMRYARWIGADSADGTYLTYGPDTNLPALLAWLHETNNQGVLT